MLESTITAKSTAKETIAAVKLHRPAQGQIDPHAHRAFLVCPFGT
jgi:hypothetical protein